MYRANDLAVQPEFEHGIGRVGVRSFEQSREPASRLGGRQGGSIPRGVAPERNFLQHGQPSYREIDPRDHPDSHPSRAEGGGPLRMHARYTSSHSTSQSASPHLGQLPATASASNTQQYYDHAQSPHPQQHPPHEQHDPRMRYASSTPRQTETFHPSPGTAGLSAATPPAERVGTPSRGAQNAFRAQQLSQQERHSPAALVASRRASIDQTSANSTQHPSHPSRPQQHHGSPRSQQSLPQHHPSQSNLQSTPKAEPTEVPRGRSPLLNPGSMTNPPSSASEPLRQKSESPKQGGSSSSQTTTLFHSYILDYLQRAGFLTTAAAFLSEKPDVSTFPLESGRHYPARSRRDSSSMRAAASNLASPAGLTIPVSHKSPISAPLFRSESGSSPVSPNQQGVSNHSTVESTTSSNSTTSHFGFDGANSAVGGDDERPSPGDEFKRDSEPELALDDTIPAAAVEHEVEAGFLYEWFHVFHDVHSARMGTGGSASARTVVESNLAAPTIGKRIQTFVQRRPAEQILRPTQVVSAQSMTASPKRYVQAQPRPQLLARRPSQLQGPAGRLAQPGMVSGRPTMTRTSSLNGAPVTPIQAGHAQPLSRQNSQHLLIQQQRENHARQQALHGRQKLHQVQLEQMHLQNQMLESPKQSQPNASNMSVPGPTSSGVSGYAADRLARSSESFGNYNAANTNSQRSQRAQEPLQPEYNESSPQPIPAGSRYVLREPVTNGNAPYLRVESAGKPGLQRTYSQPHAQQLSSNQQDKLMPPPQAIGRPPINRSLSASLVEDDNPNSTVPVGLPTQSTKRRRDSVLDSSTLGADSREVKKARSYTDLSSQGQRSTTGKSPLAQELDFSAQSGDLPANATSTRSPAAGLESPVKKTVEEIDLTAPSPLPGPPHQLGLVETVEVDVSLQDTEALLASLEDMERKSRSGELEDLSSGAVTGPTMTDAELDAFFAQSMKAVDDPDFANVAIEKEPPISIPENADFDFSEYNSFFGADAASYDPTTFDLTV